MDWHSADTEWLPGEELIEEMPTLVDARTIGEPKKQQIKEAILAISYHLAVNPSNSAGISLG